MSDKAEQDLVGDVNGTDRRSASDSAAYGMPTTDPFESVRVDTLADSRRLEKISKVGEHTVFPQDVVRLGEWKDLPSEWPVTPHIVRGPAHFCGPNLVAVRFEDSEGSVYFPIPSVVANLLGAAYEKGSRTALANARKALGLRH